MSNNPYQSPESTADEVEKLKPTKPGIVLIIFTFIIVCVNIFLCLVVAPSQGAEGSYAMGYIVGRVFIFPVIIVALFQIGKRFRNFRSQTKIFFWSSFLVFLSLLGNMSSIVQSQT